MKIREIRSLISREAMFLKEVDYVSRCNGGYNYTVQ